MVVVMEAAAADEAIEAVVAYLVATGCDVHRSSGQSTTILGVMGAVGAADVTVIQDMPQVARVVRVSEPYRLASRRFRKDPTLLEGAWGLLGGDHVWVAVEAELEGPERAP